MTAWVGTAAGWIAGFFALGAFSCLIGTILGAGTSRDVSDLHDGATMRDNLPTRPTPRRPADTEFADALARTEHAVKRHPSNGPGDAA